MTAATGFKRLGYAIAAVGLAGVAALVTISFLIPADKVRAAVTAEIRAVTGLDPVLLGETSVALFPSGTVSFDNVVLGENGGAPALGVERLTAHLRFFALLLGSVEVADIELERPTIALTLDAKGHSNWSGLIDTLARALKPNAKATSFSEIRIVDGTVVIRDDARHVAETLKGVDIALAWPSISKTFGATGRFVWRNQPIDASVTLSDFVAALAGNRSGLKLRLSGKPIKAAFDGYLSYAPTLKIDGTLAADAASLRDALTWAGQKPLPGGGFGRFALKAQTNVVGGTIALTRVNVELDGNTAEGVLTFATDGRRSLQGTLAADAIDLTPYVSTVRLLKGRQRDWDGVPISVDGLGGLDVDLRLSAAQVALSGAKLGRTAVAANLRDGHLTVTVGESQAFNGVIKGSIGLAIADPGAQFKAQLQFADVDLQSCLDAMFGLRRVEGKGDIAVSVEASGGSVLALARSLDGTATVTGRAGALVGLNVEQLLRRLERRPLSGGGDFRSGHTPFDKLLVALSISKGTVTVNDMHIEGAAVRLALAGSASIPQRDLDLKGTASLVARVPTDHAAPFELPFVVQGPWDDPIMLPDAEILIRRSGAAAPLLNAVRNRRDRDAIRSAIDRLTGHPAAAIVPQSGD